MITVSDLIVVLSCLGTICGVIFGFSGMRRSKRSEEQERLKRENDRAVSDALLQKGLSDIQASVNSVMEEQRIQIRLNNQQFQELRDAQKDLAHATELLWSRYDRHDIRLEKLDGIRERKDP